MAAELKLTLAGTVPMSKFEILYQRHNHMAAELKLTRFTKSHAHMFHQIHMHTCFTKVYMCACDLAEHCTDISSMSDHCTDKSSMGNPNSGRNRKWKALDVEIAVGLSMFHLLCVFAPFTFTWPAFWVAIGLIWLTGLGITISYHRNLSHRSFDLPKWLEYLCAYCGALAGQKDPIYWVSIHRYHHQFADTEKDPHSSKEGFWFSHMGWLFNSGYTIKKQENHANVEDLKKQPFYNFLRRTYYLHLLALASLLYGLGGFPFLVWGMGVRMVYVYHITFLINSATHTWGKRAWNTNDSSKNNWWAAVLTFGEGWHNNHHAFESSARQGLEWWQYDPTWYVICFLEALGLATNVKLPTEAQKQKKSLSF